MFGPSFAQFNMGSRRGMGVPKPVIPYAGSILLSQSVTFSSADIDVMNTPKTLVNAPGANRVIVPLLLYCTKNSYAAAPAANPTVQLYHANDVGGTNLLADTPLIAINTLPANVSQSTRFVTSAFGSGAIPSGVNQAIVVRGNINAPGGSATKSITFTLFFMVRAALA